MHTAASTQFHGGHKQQRAAHVFVGARPSRLTATPASPAASAAVAGPVRIAPTVCKGSQRRVRP